MDPSAYKKLTLSRGLTYNYYYSKAGEGKPTLVLAHGFPSSSWDWKNQVTFFKAKGFGLIVPDMLGYGGTDKPTDTKKYVPSGLA
jgi:pimeloyl-ACP methyl ester carboxylesterase